MFHVKAESACVGYAVDLVDRESVVNIVEQEDIGSLGLADVLGVDDALVFARQSRPAQRTRVNVTRVMVVTCRSYPGLCRRLIHPLTRAAIVGQEGVVRRRRDRYIVEITEERLVRVGVSGQPGKFRVIDVTRDNVDVRVAGLAVGGLQRGGRQETLLAMG